MKITKWMLEQQPTGLQVSDCAMVQIADDIPKQWIVERLHIVDCAIVKCSEALEDAVTMICEDVGSIGPVGTGEDQSIGGTINAVLGGIQGVLDTKVINAVQYVL